MRIETNHIPSRGTTLKFERKAQQFAMLKSLIENGGCDFVNPLQISLNVKPEKDFYRVSGKIQMTLRLQCARCLTDYDAPRLHRFTLNYSRQILDDIQPPDSDDVELTAQQIGMSYFEGEEIDFTQDVQEQAVMAVPYRPLCSEACKGLCPQCGVDLNKTTCQCDARPKDNPFAVLKNMKLGQ